MSDRHCPVKFERNGVLWNWWHSEKYPDMSDYMSYFYWWNWLSKGHRYIGFQTMYYDGYHYSLGMWFINWSWNCEVPFLSAWLRNRYDSWKPQRSSPRDVLNDKENA